MIPADIHFGAPSAWLLIWMVPVLIALLVLLLIYQRHAFRELGEKPLLKKLLVPHTYFNRIVPWILLILVWVLGVVALMQPEGNGRYQEELQKPAQTAQAATTQSHEVIFLLDVSASMGVVDAGQERSRLEIAKDAIDQVISSLAGETVALYIFTTQTEQLVPPTNDYIFTRMMLRNVHVNATDIAGTDLLQALTFVTDKIGKEAFDKLKTLILFSDGGDTLADVNQETEKAKRKQQLENAVQPLLRENLELIVVGVGNAQGGAVPEILYQGKPVVSVLNGTLLQGITTVGVGTYFAAEDFSTANLTQNILTIIDKQQPLGLGEKETTARQGSAGMIFDLYYQIPLALGMIVLTYVLLRYR